MGKRRWTGAVVTAAAVVAITVGSPHAEGSVPTREDSAAARTVAELTSGDHAVGVDAVLLPDDFPETIGYRPAVHHGMLVNPRGACSSPVPLPAEFDVACRAHDLGYDLLRYAHLTGGDLGPWARRAIDAQLEQRMHAACEARDWNRASCFAMAHTATTAVAANSLRQGYGVPVDEPWLRYCVVAVLAALGVAATAATVRRVVRA